MFTILLHVSVHGLNVYSWLRSIHKYSCWSQSDLTSDGNLFNWTEWPFLLVHLMKLLVYVTTCSNAWKYNHSRQISSTDLGKTKKWHIVGWQKVMSPAKLDLRGSLILSCFRPQSCDQGTCCHVGLVLNLSVPGSKSQIQVDLRAGDHLASRHGMLSKYWNDGNG